MDRTMYKPGLAVIALLALSACGGNVDGGSIVSDPPSPTFSIELQDASFFGGGSLEGISVTTTTESDKLTVEVQVDNAADLKGMFFDLHYDASSLHPVLASPSELLSPSDSTLHLAILDDSGVVHFGEAMLNPDNVQGFSGSGVVAQVEFVAGAAKKPTPKVTSEKQIPQIDLGMWSTDHLFWQYTNPGDYDLNGEVNLADIVQVAIHNGRSLSNPTPRNVIFVDGDQNGEINVADLAVIASNYQNSLVAGYDLYSCIDRSDLPRSYGQKWSQTEDAVFENHYSFSQLHSMDQDFLDQNFPVDFIVPVPSVDIEKYYWIRPASSNEVTHQTSMVVSYSDFRNGYEYQTAPELSYNSQTGILTIYYQNSGDTNQDSVVLHGDHYLQISLIKAKFQVSGPFALGSFERVLDTDRNGALNLADLAPIAVNHSNSVAGYRVFAPVDHRFPEDEKTLVVDLPFSAAVGNPETEQLRFEVDVSGLEHDYLLVQGYSYNDELSELSEVIYVGE